MKVNSTRYNHPYYDIRIPTGSEHQDRRVGKDQGREMPPNQKNSFPPPGGKIAPNGEEGTGWIQKNKYKMYLDQYFFLQEGKSVSYQPKIFKIYQKQLLPSFNETD